MNTLKKTLPKILQIKLGTNMWSKIRHLNNSAVNLQVYNFKTFYFFLK